MKLCDPWISYSHTHNCFTALWILSGTTRVSQYQKKHSPYTYRGHQSSLICFIHLLRSMASSLFNPCTWQSFSTISVQVFFGLPLGLAPWISCMILMMSIVCRALYESTGFDLFFLCVLVMMMGASASYHMSGSISIGMVDHLRVCTLPRYVMSHQGHLNLVPLVWLKMGACQSALTLSGWGVKEYPVDFCVN